MTDTSNMLLVHRVFRRELRLLATMVAATEPGDVERRRRVCLHGNEMIDALEEHHRSEDELLWPRLAARAPEATVLAGEMQRDHDVVGEAASAARSGFERWAASDVRDELRAQLEELHRQLCAHLDREERDVLPLVGRHITEGEWAELAERGFGSMPKSRALVFLAHMLEGSDITEYERMMAVVPTPVRALHKLYGRRAFQRETAYLRGGATLSTHTGQCAS